MLDGLSPPPRQREVLSWELQMSREARSRNDEQDLTAFDYAAAAELFAGTARKGNKGFTYNRFESAAEALRFAIEVAPKHAMLGAYLEVDEARFGLGQIQLLYANPRYPLRRRTDAGAESEGVRRTRIGSGTIKRSNIDHAASGRSRGGKRSH